MSTELTGKAGAGATYVERGYWLNKTLGDLLDDAVAAHPAKTALCEARTDRHGLRRISYRELADDAGRIARSLTRAGVGAGDVVTVQLPNWAEFLSVALACDRIGAIFNPTTTILREREMEYIVGLAESKVLVVPARYRGFDYEAMARAMMLRLPVPPRLVVVDNEGGNGFGQVLLATGKEDDGVPSSHLPDNASLLMFTSGTTGEPKGVVHSANALVASAKALSCRGHFSSDDVFLVSSPASHITAYVGLVVVSLYLGATLVFQDTWDPVAALDLIVKEGVTATAAAPTFISDLCDAVDCGTPAPAAMRTILCGGAPVPPSLVERATKTFNASVSSGWGMTEVLGGSFTDPLVGSSKSAVTDGQPLDGVEFKVVGGGGDALQAGEAGRLLVRGPHLLLGYFGQPQTHLDRDGWFDTGDVARLDADGYVRIVGRNKDLIIRGGENIPVVDVENALLDHPEIIEVALVGYPDERLGERVCAVMKTAPGVRIDLAAIQQHLAVRRMTPQFWPERVYTIDVMPKTPAGKIKKHELRKLIV